MMSSIYLIGSLRNPKIPQIAKELRGDGHFVFDDWFSPGPQCDDEWQKYEHERGRSYKEALEGHHAEHQFAFDLKHIRAAEVGVLVLPAGKSGHMELGYMIGRGQRGYILLEEPEPARYDLMYKFAHGIAETLEELKEMVA
jgi:hypothetical protein